MTMLFEYVVLRLSPDAIRGENINIGLAVFPQDGPALVKISAQMTKIRAIDPTWNADRQSRLQEQLEGLLSSQKKTQEKVELLSSLGFCLPGEPGFFHSTEAGMDAALREISEQYVSTHLEKEKKQGRSKLHHEMVLRFRSMDLLGSSVDDLTRHRIVPHVPIPGNPDLKGDFVYKNGVYRITQTLDYRVSAMGAHQKVAEACTKVMAAAQAIKAWGEETKKYALVCVPKEIAGIADSHLDLLFASGFEIFHADDKTDLARYHQSAFAH